jgi:hypothetical protein
MFARIKQKITEFAQHALGIDGVRYQLDSLSSQANENLNRFDKISQQLRESSESFGRLKSFLMWSSSRVEPWLPWENFAQTEPDYDLAGFLYNFLPNRTAVDAGVSDPEYPRALAEIGYQVFCVVFNPDETKRLGTLEHARIRILEKSSLAYGEQAEAENEASSSLPVLPSQIDLMKIDPARFDFLKSAPPIRPAVVQTEFASAEQPSSEIKNERAVSEIIKSMRDSEYYWNIIVYRTESEDFVRMTANLATTPKQSWGKIFFFQDYQLFLKANHWCKSALPRFTAEALPGKLLKSD